MLLTGINDRRRGCEGFCRSGRGGTDVGGVTRGDGDFRRSCIVKVVWGLRVGFRRCFGREWSMFWVLVFCL